MEYIEREAAIDAMTADNLLKHFDSVEDVIEKRFHRAAERILAKIPAADVVEVVRCRECCYAPSGTDKGKELGLGLEWPEWMANKCPLMCEDGWYSHKPEPDWFCANGKRKDGGLEPPKEEA